MRRDFFLATGGFWHCPILGAGDSALVLAATNNQRSHDHPYFARRPSLESLGGFEPWADGVTAYTFGRLGCVRGTLRHLWHGAMPLRAYSARYAWTEEFRQHHAAKTAAGLLEWTDAAPPGLRKKMREYFASRKEDAVT